jgi:hypothetical protein
VVRYPGPAGVRCLAGFRTIIITGLVVSGLPDEIQALPDGRLNLMVNDIRNLVSGNIVSRVRSDGS